MKILIVAATSFEIETLQKFLTVFGTSKADFKFKYHNLDIDILITGVGMPLTAYALGKFFSFNKVDLAINMGVAGSFSKELAIGEVVNVVAEQFGDLGAEESSGQFIDVHEMGLLPPDDFPFLKGQLIHPLFTEIAFLPKVKALTVNKVHGAEDSIKAIQQKYDVEVESMEGAAFFMVCLLEKISFLQIRAISNYVEPRNKENWNLPLSIENLNKTVIEVLQSLSNREK